MARPQPKPKWLRRPLPLPGHTRRVENALGELCLHTVCEEALCPNRGECFSHGTATFLLLGPGCTRNCAFCNVANGPSAVDPAEPANTAEAVRRLDLEFCVLTMVSRDDLPDGGAMHVADTIRAVREKKPGAGLEVLISDLGGDASALGTVLDADPNVLNHNLETVPRLYATVRPQANYQRSLEVLERAGGHKNRPVTKSGLMLGLGETEEEILAVLADLRSVGCECLTLGQYLQPSAKHLLVADFVHPDVFDRLGRVALDMGFAAVASGPYVRSSYRASAVYQTARGKREDLFT
jgi:lipoic acid synthetase